jgi:hypothetical protein
MRNRARCVACIVASTWSPVGRICAGIAIIVAPGSQGGACLYDFLTPFFVSRTGLAPRGVTNFLRTSIVFVIAALRTLLVADGSAGR